MKAGWHIDAAKMRGSPSHHSTRTKMLRIFAG